MHIRRQIDLDADLARVWHASPTATSSATGSAGRSSSRCPGGPTAPSSTTKAWSGTPLIGDVDPERRLSLRWWPDSGPEEGAVSEVTFELCPTEGGTRLVVTETALEPTTAQASVAKASYWEARLDTLWLRVSAAALVS